MIEKTTTTLQQALEYYKQGYSIIPITPKTKRASIRWRCYQKVRANKEQIQRWFEKTVNDIAILTGRVSGIIEIDIDGEEAALHFHKAVETIEDEAVRKNIENTMKIKTGSGNLNYIFGINVSDFVDGELIKTSVLWRGDKVHSEITLKGDGGYAVAPPSEHPSGNRYELVDGILSPVLLTKQQLIQLVAALKQKGKRKASSIGGNNSNLKRDINDKQITHIVSLLKPHYHLGSRNSFVMYLSGWLRKEGILIGSARKVIQGICEDDEEKDARLRTLEETYQKEAVNDIKGYSGLLEVLNDQDGDERKARTILHELESSLEQIQKKEQDDDFVDEDQKQKSIVEEASEAIMTKHRFLTIEETKEILYYRNGVYVLGAEILIEKEAESTYGYNLANHHLTEIKGHIMRSTYRSREEIDSDLNIINLMNGLYNFQTDEFKEHSPNYITVNQLPIVYDAQAKPKLFGQFLHQVLYTSEIRTAVDMMAYTFYRDNPFEIITILFGYGANGKGVYTGLLTALHGVKNISNVPLSSMLEDRFALSDLEGKSVNIDTELASTRIRDTSVLKKLTGRQPTRIQRKNQRAYDVRLYTKLYFSANKIPIAYDESDAFFRRKVILSFPNKFEGNTDDPDLLKKLTTAEELSGIFNVMMIALHRLMNRNRIFIKEKTIEQRRERYDIAANPVEAFLEDAVADDSVECDVVTKERFYQAYRHFCSNHNLAILSKESLGKILKNKFQESRGSSGKRETIWRGIKLEEKYAIESIQQTLEV